MWKCWLGSGEISRSSVWSAKRTQLILVVDSATGLGTPPEVQYAAAAFITASFFLRPLLGRGRHPFLEFNHVETFTLSAGGTGDQTLRAGPAPNEPIAIARGFSSSDNRIILDLFSQGAWVADTSGDLPCGGFLSPARPLISLHNHYRFDILVFSVALASHTWAHSR